MLTAFLAGLTGRDHAEVRALHMSWFAKLVNRSVSIGQTSRSAYTRGREHFHALERREESSVMWKHCCDRHEINEVSFVMNVTGIFRDDAMLRQITESVLINKVEEGKLINSKSEWNYVSSRGLL